MPTFPPPLPPRLPGASIPPPLPAGFVWPPTASSAPSPPAPGSTRAPAATARLPGPMPAGVIPIAPVTITPPVPVPGPLTPGVVVEIHGGRRGSPVEIACVDPESGNVFAPVERSFTPVEAYEFARRARWAFCAQSPDPLAGIRWPTLQTPGGHAWRRITP